MPFAQLKKMYGKSVMAELVNEIVRVRPNEILTERGEKSATQPDISMTEDESEADKILAAEADFEFTIAYEVIPKFELKDVSSIKVTREVVDIADEEVDTQVLQIAESAKTYETKKGKADQGDRVTMDYLGKVDGVAFDGGKDEDAELVIGSNRFIPGFEDQLVGVKAGDEKVITVTFPADYPAANLAGKEATFDIKVKDVAAAKDVEINDELATQLGLESAEKLREIVRSQLEGQYSSVSRQKLKRQILDQLDEMYDFATPEKLVSAEFDNIWRQINTDLAQSGKTFADEDTTEEAAREEYNKLAQRRVRLVSFFRKSATRPRSKSPTRKCSSRSSHSCASSPARRRNPRLLPQYARCCRFAARADLRREGHRPSAERDFCHGQEGLQGRAARRRRSRRQV